MSILSHQSRGHARWRAGFAAALPALLLGACAHIERSSPRIIGLPETSCQALADDVARTRQVRDKARQARSDAWKAILPLLAASRLAYAQSRLNEADARLQLLERLRARQGCRNELDTGMAGRARSSHRGGGA